MAKPKRIVKKGAENFEEKIPEMFKRFSGSKGRAIEEYKKVGFLKTFAEAYEEAWEIKMIEHYGLKVRPDLSEKWRKNYSKKMFGREL